MLCVSRSCNGLRDEARGAAAGAESRAISQRACETRGVSVGASGRLLTVLRPEERPEKRSGSASALQLAQFDHTRSRMIIEDRHSCFCCYSRFAKKKTRIPVARIRVRFRLRKSDARASIVIFRGSDFDHVAQYRSRFRDRSHNERSSSGL